MAVETFLYLTTIGHKSGNPHEIEIWYVDHADKFYLCSGGRERAHWVQNILAQPQVRFSVGIPANHNAVLPPTDALTRPLDPTTDKNLHHIVTQLFNGKYGWSEGLLIEVIPPEQEA